MLEGDAERRQVHGLRRPARRRQCPRAHRGHARTAIKGSKVELVDVRGDDIDQTRAKRNVEDTLAANPDINCMVGFYSYNTPRIYEALKDAGKLGQITVIGFDEDPITLGGVKEGTIVGTVVQQPFEWGYQGMKLMAEYLKGDKSGIPANGLIIIPTKIIDKANVDAFMAELKRCTASSSQRPGMRTGRHSLAGPRASRRTAARRRCKLTMPSRSSNSSRSRKTYPGVVALRRVDLARSAAARCMGLIGENGAGKSTLMKVLGGVTQPTRGTIRLDGASTPALTVARAIAAGIAFVHQELNLFDNLDVAANVFIGREPLLRRAAAADRPRRRCAPGAAAARAARRRFRGRHAGRRPVAGPAADGGDRQGAVARGRLVIMDEPTSSLTLDRDRPAAARSSPTSRRAGSASSSFRIA